MTTVMTKNQRRVRDALVTKMKTGQYALTPNACLCGQKNDTPLAGKDRYDIPVRALLCLVCGLVRSDPYYTEKTLAEFYNREYRPLYNRENQTLENFFDEQVTFGRHIYNFLAEKVFPEGIRGKKIFEIGCGAGGILEAFRQRGNAVFGCDYGQSYLEFGKQKGLGLVSGGSEGLRPFGRADIVILNHTLEHMTKPKEELPAIKKLLSPDGIIYIALPGIFSIHDTYRGNLMEYLQNAHVWYFTLKTLNSLLSGAGFQLIAGNEIITAVYRQGPEKGKPEPENPRKILRYLKKTARLRWYYGLKKFSLRRAAFETLRKTGPLYRLSRAAYRKLNANYETPLSGEKPVPRALAGREAKEPDSPRRQ